MKSTLALASLIISLSSPLILAAPYAQSSPFQDISSSSASPSASTSKSQVLMTISTLNTNVAQRQAEYKTIPISLSADHYGSYLEGFADLAALDVDDEASDPWSSNSNGNSNSNGQRNSNTGIDLRLSTVSFTSSNDIDSPICSFRIAKDTSASASGRFDSNDDNDNNIVDTGSSNGNFRANGNTGSSRLYGKPFPGGDGRAIMGSEISGGIGRMVNGVYCIAKNNKWAENGPEPGLELGAADVDVERDADADGEIGDPLVGSSADV